MYVNTTIEGLFIIKEVILKYILLKFKWYTKVHLIKI